MNESRSSLKKKRIRRFFLNFGPLEIEKEESIQQEVETGLKYTQMRLPIEKITPEMEQKLKEKIQPHILKADVRECSGEDLEKLMYIYNRSWMTTNTPFSPIELDSLQSIHDYPETVILIVKLYGKDVGFIILDFEGDNNQYGVIAGLGVLPSYQGKGIGKLLALHAWDKFEEKGVEELRCEVYSKNERAERFIRSIGFEKYDEKVYKKGDFELA
jgi:ribosomal protein S18 acetylase RimI-like enzyme